MLWPTALFVVPLITNAFAKLADGSVCSWEELRGGVVQESLWLEGGYYKTMVDGSCNGAVNNSGTLFTLNFTAAWNGQTNLTQLLTPMVETVDSSSVTYFDGGLFASDREWYTFGGQAYPEVDSYKDNTAITRYAVKPANAQAVAGQLGPSPDQSIQSNSNLTTKYVTNGAGVSVPSESLGFYFSGLRTPSGSNISWSPRSDNSDAPSVLVRSMVKVDLSVYGEPVWSEIPLPNGVAPRAEAVLSWVPIGSRGALVVVGGVPAPVDVPQLQQVGCTPANDSYTSPNSDSSFVTQIPVYDIGSGQWFSVNTTGGPPPSVAQACSVVATSPDNSVHNIHMYGGYSGSDATSVYDDVWVLSLPSFTWIKAYSGNDAHSRYSHFCAKPYPDQMIVVGGTKNCDDTLESAIIDNFDLNNLTFTGAYSPSKYTDYVVPSQISAAIQATPTASMDPALQNMFASPLVNVSHWYPYVNASPAPPPHHHAWLVPVVATIAAVAGIAIVAFSWWFCCCRSSRKAAKNGSTSHTTQNQNRIVAWLTGNQRNAATASTRSEDDFTHVGSPRAYEIDSYFKAAPHTNVAELNSDHGYSSPPLSDPYSSPRAPNSPRNIELDAVTPQELPTETHGLFNTHNIRNHPMYPLSISGHTKSVATRSVSSPYSHPTGQYELPQNRSNEEILPPAPNDLVLESGRASPDMSAVGSLSPANKTSVAHATEISPMLHATEPKTATATIVPAPVTPPIKASRAQIVDVQHSQNPDRPQHHRHTSSMSSGISQIQSPGFSALSGGVPSPRESERHSTKIASWPDSPDRPTGGQTSASAGSPIKRKDIGGGANAMTWLRPTQSVRDEDENDDLYSSSDRWDARGTL